ncbi:MAG: hypothetical protein ACK4TP_10180 [Hyphomicrobium sp.]
MAQLQIAVAMLAVFISGIAFLLVVEVRQLWRKVGVLERHVGELIVWYDKTKRREPPEPPPLRRERSE